MAQNNGFFARTLSIADGGGVSRTFAEQQIIQKVKTMMQQVQTAIKYKDNKANHKGFDELELCTKSLTRAVYGPPAATAVESANKTADEHWEQAINSSPSLRR